MTHFAELLKNPAGRAPDALQKDARGAFPGLVAGSTFALRRPGGPIPESGKCVVLGVATYSTADMELLDRLESNLRPAIAHIEVFDVLDCETMGDFCRYIPGVGQVYQTPVVGVWSDGQLVDTASGMAATRDVLQAHGLSF